MRKIILISMVSLISLAFSSVENSDNKIENSIHKLDEYRVAVHCCSTTSEGKMTCWEYDYGKKRLSKSQHGK